MAKFKYIGDHPQTEVFEHIFPQGKPVEVKQEAFVAKLRGNPHFEEVRAQAVKKTNGDTNK